MQWLFPWVPESSHPRLATGEVSTGIADAFPARAQPALPLFKVFLYRLWQSLELGREFWSLRLCCSRGVSAQEFQETGASGGFKTLSLCQCEGVRQAGHIPRRLPCRIFPKRQRSEEIPVDGSPGISL
ncbi:hypothetical protein RB195_013028 [Necator americanus]|uniref:Uncharacterized protein n=1 Tax=Necator americanus TaxID=51031 RepID=A0ABR1DTN5_NECAM